MIEVENLTKRYGDSEVVSNVSFTAQTGDILGFLGPNGAGKTTTMRMLVTYLPPTSGTARIAGHDILTEGDEVRKKIGYLPETPPLYLEMRVTEYLRFVGELRGLRGRLLKARVDEVIQLCAIEKVVKKLCGHLSKGYRQRMGLAQAIIHNPEVLILDEPTSGLDPVQIIEIRKLIRELSEGHTVILSTHILQEVAEVCNKVVILCDGKVVLDSSLEEDQDVRSLEQAFVSAVSVRTMESDQNII